MSENVVALKPQTEKLKCTGVGRDGENEKCLIAYFNQSPTDDQMRFFHDCLKRWAMLK